MQGFEAPIFLPSSHRCKWPALQFKRIRCENCCSKFSWNATHTNNPDIVYYTRIAYFNLKNQLQHHNMSPISHLTLQDGVMIADPDNPSTPHSCRSGNAKLLEKMLTKIGMVKVQTHIPENRKSFQQVFHEAISYVEKRFDNQCAEIRNTFKSAMKAHYGYASKNQTLSRNRQFNVTKGNN